MDNLSENEYTLLHLLPETASNLSETMEISVSYVYDLVEQLRRKGAPIEQDMDGRYYLMGDEEDRDEPVDISSAVLDSDSKAQVTRQAKKTLAELEYGLKTTLQEMEPASTVIPARDDNTDLILHRTDDHFGEHVTNQHGEVTFNSEIAEARVDEYFESALETAESRRAMGTEFDAVHLLLGGDMITNETIYDGQAAEVDQTLEEQLDHAANVYIEKIRELSAEFPAVRVVCQPGNHGRLSGSTSTNADNILYGMLDKVVRESSMDNVTFLQSDRSYYIDTSIRDWNVHLRHGHDSSLEHIGTSAGKQRWLSWLVDHGFDVAFRGHYHVYKEEPINGRPVHLGGSLVPQTEFEESHALSGAAMGAVHGATDEAPTKWTEKIYFS